MSPETGGLHHVTAIAGDAQRNADFYVRVLGLRFVKRTVNHDDTHTYHLYFGDGVGTPGTNVTFFPWGDDAREGRFGAGQTQDTAYGVPRDSVDYWAGRLDDHDVAYERTERFGEPVLSFDDPDGIGVEVIGTDDEPHDWTAWDDGPVPPEHQLRGFHSVTLALTSRGATADTLEALGYERQDAAEDGAARGRVRYRTPEGGLGSVVDLVETDDGAGRMGAGTVHHVAFRAEDDEHQREIQRAMREFGLQPTEVVDRTYFRSVYFREPGGVLFEVATMGPGFDADEAVDALGESLVLPEWLESEREEIEASLPPLDHPMQRP